MEQEVMVRTSNRNFGRYRIFVAGFTVIELLVSLAVISILLSLILPIIQLANEAARQSACMNNLRQIGMALSESEASSGKIPSARIVTKDVKYQRSIHVSLLPFLEQSALYEQYDAEEDGLGILKDPPTSKVNGPLLAARVPVYLCTSDPSHILRNSYRICSRTSPGMHETTDQPVINQSLSGFRSKSGQKNPAFIDGRSNTVAFSERVAGDGNQGDYVPSTDIRTLSIKTHGLKTPSDVTDACNWPSLADPKHVSFAGSTWLLSGYTQTWYNHILVPNAATTDCTDGGPESLGAYSARSFHDGSVNILLADGAVRRASDEIDLAIWRAIGTVAGGEEIGDY